MNFSIILLLFGKNSALNEKNNLQSFGEVFEMKFVGCAEKIASGLGNAICRLAIFSNSHKIRSKTSQKRIIFYDNK